MKKIAIVLLSIVMMLSSLACALPQGMRMSASSPAAQQTEKDAAKETDDAAKSDAKTDDKAEADADADAEVDAEADTDAGDAEEPDDGRFPAELFGVWKLVSCEGLEQDEAESLNFFVCSCSCDGQVAFSGTDLFPVNDIEAATVDGDEIMFPSLTERENSDLHLYYSVEDSEDGPVLTLNFTGETDLDTRKATKVDVEAVYEKADGKTLEHLYEFAMVGDWTDSNGATWTFNRSESELFLEVEFEMINRSGTKIKCYEFRPVTFKYDETAEEMLASFTFEDRRNNITDAEVESFDGYTLVLTLDDETLELTRVK